MRPRVAVVIVNWNGRQETLDCVASLLASSQAPWRILIVDNGSDDGSPAAIRDRYPDAELLESCRNLGFAAGNNLAFRELEADPPDHVGLLNNDARPAAGALAALVGIAEADRGVGAVGSRLVRPDGAVEAWGGGSVSFLSGLPRHHRAPQEPAELQYLVGASLLLRWAALSQVGYFDERYFLYWEDADLCFRLRAAGWTLGVAREAIVRHQGQASTGFRTLTWDREFTASSVVFYRRHGRRALLPIAVGSGGRLVRRALDGRWTNVRATWQGLVRGLTSRRRAS